MYNPNQNHTILTSVPNLDYLILWHYAISTYDYYCPVSFVDNNFKWLNIPLSGIVNSLFHCAT